MSDSPSTSDSSPEVVASLSSTVPSLASTTPTSLYTLPANPTDGQLAGNLYSLRLSQLEEATIAGYQRTIKGENVARLLVMDTPVYQSEFSDRIEPLLKASHDNCPHCKDVLTSSLLGSFMKTKPPTKEALEGGVCTTTALLVLVKAGILVRLLLIHSFNPKMSKLSYVKGGLTFRRAWKLYEAARSFAHESGLWPEGDTEASGVEAAATKPPDAESPVATESWISDLAFGVGLFHFIVAMIPPGYMWLAEAVGFKGDLPHGHALMRACATGNGMVSTLASIILDIELGFKAFIQRLPSDPENAILLYLVGFAARDSGDPKLSQDIFDRLELLGVNNGIAQMRLMARVEQGLTKTRLLQFEEAAELLNDYLENTQTLAYRSWSAYELGVCRIVMDDIAGAKKAFQLSTSSARDNYTWDQYAARKSSEYLKKGMSPLELLYYKAEMSFRIRNHKEALEFLTEAEALKKTADDSCLYYYLKGRSLQAIGETSEAHACYSKCIAIKPSEEKWTIAHSLVRLAEMAWKEGDGSTAKGLLAKARKMKSYDFLALNIRRIDRLESAINGTAIQPMSSS